MSEAQPLSDAERIATARAAGIAVAQRMKQRLDDCVKNLGYLEASVVNACVDDVAKSLKAANDLAHMFGKDRGAQLMFALIDCVEIVLHEMRAGGREAEKL